MQYKRRINEIIVLYELEPNLNDIYVEGISDKLIFDRYLKKYINESVKVKTVDDIDFREIYEKYPDIKRNKKKKLIALCELIEQSFEENLKGISIIIDRDFDEMKGELKENDYIFYTDYNSLELYLFDCNIINIFYKNFLRGFPFSGEHTLNTISPILIEKFLIRLILDSIGPYLKEQITDLKKSVSVNKQTGAIEFFTESHLKKILNNVGKTGEKEFCLELIEEYRRILPSEKKKCIKGHDFIHLLFIFIDKIKNNIKLSEQTFERLIFQCIDYSALRNENLFAGIEQKYLNI